MPVKALIATFLPRTPRRGATVNRRIFSAMLTVGSVTAVVKLSSAVKDILVARQFGVGDAVDSFFIAIMLPMFATSVIADSFGLALIPTLVRADESQGRASARRLFSNSVILGSGLLLIVASILGIGFPYFLRIITAEASAAKVEMITRLFYLTLPVVLIAGMSAMWAAAMNACRAFLLVSITPIIQPLAIVSLLLVFRGTSAARIDLLAYGLMTGAVLEMIVVGCALRRKGYAILPRWSGVDSNLLTVAKQYAPLVAGALVMSSSTVVDQSFASTLGSGGVSALAYGNKVVAFTNGLAALAVSKSVMPFFSELVARNDWQAMRRTLWVYLALIVGVMTIVTVGVVLASEPIVRFLFQKGKFTHQDATLVASILRLYAVQMPFYIGGTLIVTVLAALRACRVFLFSAVINVIVNVVLDIVFIKWIGVRGIALSTSFVYLCSFCYLLTILLRKMKREMA